MKGVIEQVIQSAADDLTRNLVREYLQARVLQILQEDGAFLDWAFLGGTALRFLYTIPRFSEDLDFSTHSSAADDRFRERLVKVKKAFEAEGYSIDVKVGDQKVVKTAFLRFRGLLSELGLSPHASETVSIRVEIDTNPPAGAVTVTTLVRRHVTLNLLHHDRASLLAGKLHALLARPFVKGRDLYDLVWCLADRSWPEPNLHLLNAALVQTGDQVGELDSANWRSAIWTRLESIDWSQAAQDVRPFLERQEEAALLTKANCCELLLGEY